MTKIRSDKLNWIRREIMSFKNMFKDSNDTNEKSVVGFCAFIVMVIYGAMDMITAFMGKAFAINETIFGAFTVIVLGAFGIAVIDKIFTPKNTKPGITSTTDTTTTTTTNDKIDLTP